VPKESEQKWEIPLGLILCGRIAAFPNTVRFHRHDVVAITFGSFQRSQPLNSSLTLGTASHYREWRGCNRRAASALRAEEEPFRRSARLPCLSLSSHGSCLRLKEECLRSITRTLVRALLSISRHVANRSAVSRLCARVNNVVNNCSLPRGVYQ